MSTILCMLSSSKFVILTNAVHFHKLPKSASSFASSPSHSCSTKCSIFPTSNILPAGIDLSSTHTSIPLLVIPPFPPSHRTPFFTRQSYRKRSFSSLLDLPQGEMWQRIYCVYHCILSCEKRGRGEKISPGLLDAFFFSHCVCEARWEKLTEGHNGRHTHNAKNVPQTSIELVPHSRWFPKRGKKKNHCCKLSLLKVKLKKGVLCVAFHFGLGGRAETWIIHHHQSDMLWVLSN